MNPRKIDLMHWYFGIDRSHKCGECANLVEGRYHNRILRKCRVYGLTHSAASDWAKKYTACGMFGKEWHGREIISLVRSGRNAKGPVATMDGQMEITGGT